MLVNSTNNGALRCSSAKSSPERRKPLMLCLAGLLFMWFGLTACPVRAENPLPGHIYVNYTTYNIPAKSGTTIDVTDTLTYTQNHVYDCYGNTLIIDSVNNTVTDSSSNVVGYICHPHD